MKISIIFLFMKTSADLISYNRGWNNLNDHYSNRISSISENGHKKKTLDPEIQLLLHLLHQKKNHLFIKEKIGNVRRTPKQKSRKNYRLKLYKKSFWKLAQINKIRIFQFSLWRYNWFWSSYDRKVVKTYRVHDFWLQKARWYIEWCSESFLSANRFRICSVFLWILWRLI